MKTSDAACELRRSIEHAAHLLPSQGPITVFVHHNTLHAFEDGDFEHGVKDGGLLFGCHAYLSEGQYHRLLESGRIRLEDLEAVLLEDLGDEADQFVAMFGTLYELRLAMLQSTLRTGAPAELHWVIAETDALQRFAKEVRQSVRDELICETRQWVLATLQSDSARDLKQGRGALAEVMGQFDRRSIASWSESEWEAFVLNLLWRVCCDGVATAAVDTPPPLPLPGEVLRHRDLLMRATGQDADVLANEVLIPFCAAFLDQYFAQWELPGRRAGMFQSFLALYEPSFASPTGWHATLQREARRIRQSGMGPLESIQESLDLFDVPLADRDDFILKTLLALRGWAGMVWQMETNAEWTAHPAPPDSLIEFLAVRLILDRLAFASASQEALGVDGTSSQMRQVLTDRMARELGAEGESSTEQRAFAIYQLAQARGWKPEHLIGLSHEQWKTLECEVERFTTLERRRVFHLAYERKYRNETLDAVIAHTIRQRTKSAKPNDDRAEPKKPPSFQIACCIDDREESLRRHLEEVAPDCETFGIAGFFGVAMYHRGVGDAHFKPLCPVNVKPSHYVVEEPTYSFMLAEQRRAQARRQIGRATHQAHRGTRTFLGGVVMGLFGSLAAFPLVARVLFPRTTAQIRHLFDVIVQTPATELRLERIESEPGAEGGHVGYSVVEMAGIVEGGLRAMGVVAAESFSRLFVICGHGSSSVNNPHRAAYDCGACGGGRGGPNARAFAQMANDPRVRRIVEGRGLAIPDETYFVGAYHNTCDDSIAWYDLDRVPVSHRALFEEVKAALDEARRRDAHERCRRFESADLTFSFDEALRHVEGRSEDLSQARPECGHATNALCFVGRRDWSRGLFLDRRAFLTSYDPARDDQRSSILERLLQAVIPVCAGINLEYYFSYVDPIGYGCSTKLPHNVASLLGVMDGAASDLRPGLPWQMVEIHEPVRLLFVIETTPAALRRIIDDNEAIARLVDGDWVQVAVLDAKDSQILRYRRGEFVPYEPGSRRLPIAESSLDWYGGRREHLGFASIEDRTSLPRSVPSAVGGEGN
ncbi:MAG: DUF2309 domain-containing protein [Pirellulales bacterium]